VFGSYGFGQAYYGDGPAGTAIIIPGPKDIIRLQAHFRRHVDLEVNIRRTMTGKVSIRTRVDLEVER
jgi:hypothetical protein